MKQRYVFAISLAFLAFSSDAVVPSHSVTEQPFSSLESQGFWIHPAKAAKKNALRLTSRYIGNSPFELIRNHEQITTEDSFPLHRAVSQRAFVVSVIDMFYESSFPPGSDTHTQSELISADAIDIDNDGVRDLVLHGDIVSTLLQAPFISIRKFPIKTHRYAREEIRAQLLQIHSLLSQGEKIDAVLLCYEASTFSRYFDSELKKEDAQSYAIKLRSWAKDDNRWEVTADIINLLETLSHQGVSVVTIAGNSGKSMVNTYSFAKDITIVAGEEADERGVWISNNPFINKKTRSTYQAVLIEQSQSKKGYSLGPSQQIDIPIEQTSFAAYGGVSKGALLRGSSYAAPVALRTMLEEQSYFGGFSKDQS